MFSLGGRLYMLNARSTLLLTYAGEGRWHAVHRRVPLKLANTPGVELAWSNPPQRCVLYHRATGNVFLAHDDLRIEFLTRGPAADKACLACDGESCLLFGLAGAGANPLNTSCRPVRLDLCSGQFSAVGCDIRAEPVYAVILRGRAFVMGLQRGHTGCNLCALEVCGQKARPLPVREVGRPSASPASPSRGPVLLPCTRPLLRFQAYDRYAVLVFLAGERCRLLLIDSFAADGAPAFATVRDLPKKDVFLRLGGEVDGSLWRARYLISRSGWLELPESLWGLLQADHLAVSSTGPEAAPGGGDDPIGDLFRSSSPSRRRNLLDEAPAEPEEEFVPFLGPVGQRAPRTPDRLRPGRARGSLPSSASPSAPSSVPPSPPSSARSPRQSPPAPHGAPRIRAALARSGRTESDRQASPSRELSFADLTASEPPGSRSVSPGARAARDSLVSEAVATATASLASRNAQLQSRVEILEEALARQREASVAATGRIFLLEEKVSALQQALDESRHGLAEFRITVGQEEARREKRLTATEETIRRQAEALARLQALVSLGDDGRPR